MDKVRTTLEGSSPFAERAQLADLLTSLLSPLSVSLSQIKQVFSHSDKTADTTSTGHSSSATHSTTGSTTAPPTRSSAGDRTAGDVVEPSASRAASATTTDSVNKTTPGADTGLSSTTGSSATTGTHSTHESHGTHGTHGTHSTHGTYGTEGSHHGLTGERTHLKESALPPNHQHQHPREDGLLDVSDAKAATHDHQHLAPVTREPFRCVHCDKDTSLTLCYRRREAPGPRGRGGRAPARG